MSTNAIVYIRLKEEDKGKVLKFNPSLTKEADRDSGNVRRELNVENDIAIIGAYVHWDGDTIIESLKEHFNDYDSALNLILGGAMSYISDNIVRFYTSWRDEPYEVYKVKETGKLKHKYIPCTYLFEDNQWKEL